MTDTIARKAALLRLEDAKHHIDVAIDAVTNGWVRGQFPRIIGGLNKAKQSTYDASVLLERGARRVEKRRRA